MLCYLFDEKGRVLLLHRKKPPNQDLYSPVGGKLEQPLGESPTMCAVREIFEETGLQLATEDLHLTGIVSEAAYEGHTHWLMFLYEVVRPVQVTLRSFDEGLLEWHEKSDIPQLPIPLTDQGVIWPLFWKYRGKFFTAHIACSPGGMTWRIEQPMEDITQEKPVVAPR